MITSLWNVRFPLSATGENASFRRSPNSGILCPHTAGGIPAQRQSARVLSMFIRRGTASRTGPGCIERRFGRESDRTVPVI